MKSFISRSSSTKSNNSFSTPSQSSPLRNHNNIMSKIKCQLSSTTIRIKIHIRLTMTKIVKRKSTIKIFSTIIQRMNSKSNARNFKKYPSQKYLYSRQSLNPIMLFSPYKKTSSSPTTITSTAMSIRLSYSKAHNTFANVSYSHYLPMNLKLFIRPIKRK